MQIEKFEGGLNLMMDNADSVCDQKLRFMAHGEVEISMTSAGHNDRWHGCLCPAMCADRSNCLRSCEDIKIYFQDS